MQRTSIRKAGLLTVFIGAFALSIAQAMGATTGSITISGTVPAATAIVVTPDTGYNSLDLTTTASNQRVATIREINNTTAGYTVTLASANSGELRNGSLGSVFYTAKYNSSTVSLSSTPVTITSQGSQSGVVNTEKDFTISFTGASAESLMVGTYSDTLTFTISAN